MTDFERGLNLGWSAAWAVPLNAVLAAAFGSGWAGFVGGLGLSWAWLAWGARRGWL